MVEETLGSLIVEEEEEEEEEETENRIRRSINE